MNVPPLAIVQARMGSKRLPGKVLMDIAGKSLVEHVWLRAVEAFGQAHTVVAYPDTLENAPLRAELYDIGAISVAYAGDEWDLLGRYWWTAHKFRWHPDSVIVRVCADDPFKSASAMKRVAAGERLPVEVGAEAFTLAQLDAAHFREADPTRREHLTYCLFPVLPPPPPPGTWTIDTPEDLETVRALFT